MNFSAERHGLSRPLAGILLALLVVAAFWPVVSGRRTFFQLDLRYEHLPVWEATQRALRAGESPFWIGAEFCGHPLLFTQEAPVFHPSTVPLLLTGAPVHRLADLFSLPAGRHRVLFEYHAPGVREGAGLFAAAVLGLALFAMRARESSDG